MGAEGIAAIGGLLLNYQKLEYLGLAKNGIADLCLLKPILSNIGKQVLSQEELEKYRAKEKERDDLLADAKKKKKKLNDDEIPQLYSLVEIQAGQFAYVKNPQLRMLNLNLNPLGSKSDEIDLMLDFISTQSDSFQLSV